MIQIKSKKALWGMLLLLAQMIIIAVAGALGGDVWYAIIVSVVGVVFNMLTSFKISYGFLAGVIFAIGNGIVSYLNKAYATFGFMIFMQAPVALYTFISWKRNRNPQGVVLKGLTWQKALILTAFMAATFVGSYFLMRALGGANLIPDSLFLVINVVSCLLLAMRYKFAYIVVLMSGLSGTLLWGVQMAKGGNGLSLMILYIIVAINSVLGIIKNYRKPMLPVESPEQCDNIIAQEVDK